MKYSDKYAALMLAVAVAGCGDDTAPPEEGRATEGDATTSGGVTLTTAATEATESSGETADDTEPGGGAMAFLVTIENLSSRTALPTPLSPGVWATHDASAHLFGDGEAATIGLQALAEDGDPARLQEQLRGVDGIGFTDVFDTPRGSGAAGPALPSDAYEITIMASADTPRLSFVSMIAQSNDVFVATPPEGIALFDDDGQPIGATDISGRMVLWDAGSEANEAPGMGANQAPRQDGPDTGAPEVGVFPFTHETRGLPIGRALADVTIEEANGEFTILIENIAEDMVTPLSPVFYAVHDETFTMFDPAAPARDGLEALAEDGDPSAMVDAHAGTNGVLVAGMQDLPMGVSMPRPAEPGEAFEIVVRPNAAHRWLSFATMVAQTNDVFLALPPEGVALVDELGNPRELEMIEMEIGRQLATWDAGTEQNEVPGVGLDQAPRQVAPDTGPAEDAPVRRYGDMSNDLGGRSLGGFMDVQIVGNGDGSFAVTVSNTSDETAYPGLLSPLVWVLHNDARPLFRMGETASRGLESLAEDGDPMPLLEEVQNDDGIMMAGVVGMADGPLGPGQVYMFTVTPDANNRWFDFASMVVPSNDTFAAFGTSGVALLDESGAPRSDGQIALDVSAMLQAWDAGTEANQPSAAGRDQPPYQAGANIGATQGNGLVRKFDDPVWIYPSPEDSIRVTIHPRP